jgi:hypothetical protein
MVGRIDALVGQVGLHPMQRDVKGDDAYLIPMVEVVLIQCFQETLESLGFVLMLFGGGHHRRLLRYNSIYPEGKSSPVT